MLAELCDTTFLKLWSYANPYKDDHHELCDLLAVFGNSVFVFFDREIELDTSGDDFKVRWDRWKRKAVEAQIKTARGAERYLKSGRPVYLDGKGSEAFPINIAPEQMVVHKIVVAHGAKEACRSFSSTNSTGSLGIWYGQQTPNSLSFPFVIDLDRRDPVHVLDSESLPIILSELDTVADFGAYLDEKTRAIKSLELLAYSGEEDLLAHYYCNFDETSKRHFIGVEEPRVNAVAIEEGEWTTFVESDLYKETKRANEESYFWDDLLQLTSQNSLDGTLLGADPKTGPSAVAEMAREPRFVRRELSEGVRHAIQRFPGPPKPGSITRHVLLMPSYYEGTAYVFLQMAVDAKLRKRPDYREKRQKILSIACGAAKNRDPSLKKIVGIAIDAPKLVKENAEDFLLLCCETWTGEDRNYWEAENRPWRFFHESTTSYKHRKISEFVTPSTPDRGSAY